MKNIRKPHKSLVKNPNLSIIGGIFLFLNMLKTTFTLISKKELTHDVYELIYSCPDLSKELPKPGQYVMFQLAPGLNRSYSLSGFSSESFTLIIKRVDEGKGSPIICDAPIGTIFSGMIPLGHFVLQDTLVSKCFIGTGTGFAPLYCQLLGMTAKNIVDTSVGFIFWVREQRDIFYTDEIVEIGKKFGKFDYQSYLSREQIEGFQHGYVTDWIIPENTGLYEEFYLCGSPAMVKSAREKLETLGITKEKIFWEQF